MAHGGLGRVVWGLGLRDVDNGTGHAANQDKTARNLALNQVLSDPSREVVRAINVDAPKLLHPIGRV